MYLLNILNDNHTKKIKKILKNYNLIPLHTLFKNKSKLYIITLDIYNILICKEKIGISTIGFNETLSKKFINQILQEENAFISIGDFKTFLKVLT